jgi:hypothetical protein
MSLTGDLLTNMQMDGGTVKCHSTVDAVLTTSGDLALVADDSTGMQQRLMIWMATPPGERFDPTIGCPWYSYAHKKMSSANIKELANEMTNSFVKFFPELDVSRIEISKLDTRTLFVEVYAGDGVNFIFTKEDQDESYKNFWSTFKVDKYS